VRVAPTYRLPTGTRVEFGVMTLRGHSFQNLVTQRHRFLGRFIRCRQFNCELGGRETLCDVTLSVNLIDIHDIATLDAILAMEHSADTVQHSDLHLFLPFAL